MKSREFLKIRCSCRLVDGVSDFREKSREIGLGYQNCMWRSGTWEVGGAGVIILVLQNLLGMALVSTRMLTLIDLAMNNSTYVNVVDAAQPLYTEHCSNGHKILRVCALYDS